jgi:PBSX family phage terminase large subunit
MATATANIDFSPEGELWLQTYPKQTEFVDSTAFISGFVAGRGAGKSWIASLKLLMRAKAGRFYGVVAPTYPVMMDTIWRTFVSLAKQTGQLVKEVKSKPPSVVIRTLDGGTADVSFRTGEDPERLRGPNYSGVILEEASIMHEDVLTIVLACLREGGELGWLDFVFTPKGKLHWTYNVFFDEEGNLKPGKHLTHARTEDNPFNAPEFVQNMRANYTSALAQQELDGLFVDLAGLLFKRHWFEFIDASQVPMKAQRVRYWDKAAVEDGGDYSAGVLVAYADGIFYVEDVVRGQWTPAVRNRIMRQVATMDHAKYRGSVKIWVEQEPGSGGKESAILSIHNLAGFPVWTETASGQQHRVKDHLKIPGKGKIVRAQPFAAQAEHGNVKVVSASWNADWLDELMAFPEAVHDDQVDATAGAFNKLALRQPATKEKPTSVASRITVPRSMQFDRRGGGMFGRR